MARHFCHRHHQVGLAGLKLLFLGDAEEEEIAAHAVASACLGDADQLVLVGAQLIVAHAAALVFLDDFSQEARDFVIDGFGGKLAFDLRQKRLERLAPLCLFEMRFGHFFQPFADVCAEGIQRLARVDLFGEGVIERRK